MFKNYSKDQKLVLLGACLYYMGLGGFLFNSQSTVLAAVRSLYDFPMTKMSIYTTAGYATQIFASALLGSVIFRLSQSMKKYYFAGMYVVSAIGLVILALFAQTPLFYLSRVMVALGVSTVSIIIPYIINQWITVNPSSAVGLASACAGLGGVVSNPLAAFLFKKYSTEKGIIPIPKMMSSANVYIGIGFNLGKAKYMPSMQGKSKRANRLAKQSKES